MKKREGVTKVTSVRDPKRIGVKGRQVRINWEGKISFGKGLIEEIYRTMDIEDVFVDVYYMTLRENIGKSILHLDFTCDPNPDDDPNDDTEYYDLRIENKPNGGVVVNCRDGLRGVSIEKVRHLVNQTQENKTITSICDDDPSVSVSDDKNEVEIQVKIT